MPVRMIGMNMHSNLMDKTQLYLKKFFCIFLIFASQNQGCKIASVKCCLCHTGLFTSLKGSWLAQPPGFWA